MLNTHKDWMAGKSATVNNKDDLIQTEGTAREQAAFLTKNGLQINLQTKNNYKD
ncbi:hypothetical protein [Parabacteroides johnsonii]|uniref:hypothetical protein n=1 Tax=Parabacteroides johnsonii TaxID=387661 RepID=UPI001898C979|nr:hypothetical protein [Parabacteroides johnsonii]